jgi:hypothetical protein
MLNVCGEMSNASKNFIEEPQDGRMLVRPRRWWITLKYILETGWKVWTDSTGSGCRPMTGFREDSHKPPSTSTFEKSQTFRRRVIMLKLIS